MEERMGHIVSQCRAAFKARKLHTYEQRMQALDCIDQFLVQEEEAIFHALKVDLGKCEGEASLSEFALCRSEIAYMQNNLKSWMAMKPAGRLLPFVLTMDTAGVQSQPYGVVTLLCPWNYPLYLTVVPLIGAVAAGNCCIIKPSEISPAMAKVFEDSLNKYMPKDCFPVVCGGIPESTALLKQRVDYIFYTGSTAVGRVVMKAAAEHLTPVTLELGGKCPTYIDESADIQLTAQRLICSKCLNAGQICISHDYILCTRKTQDKFVAAAREVLAKSFGEDMQKSPDYSRIINDRHFQRLSSLLEKTRATIAIDKGSDRADRYMGLKILTDVSPTDAVMQDEIFGPILPIVTVSGVDEAIDFINEREKPLHCYVYSKANDVVKRFIDETSSGGIMANDSTLNMQLHTLPFGGVGASGIGAYHGKYSFDTFSHRRSVFLRNQNMEFINTRFRYPPLNTTSLYALRELMYGVPGRSVVQWLKGLVVAVLALLGFVTVSLREQQPQRRLRR